MGQSVLYFRFRYFDHSILPKFTDSHALNQAFSETCLCGRSFSQIYALANHRRACKQSKKRLSSALSQAKELWVDRKCPRQAPCEPPQIDRFAEEEVNISFLHYEY